MPAPLAPKVSKSFPESMRTVGATEGICVIPDGDVYPLSGAVKAGGLSQIIEAFLV